MCGYNKINNVWACEDPATLSILRDQLQDDSLRHWLYPHGTLAVTTQADHSCGLTLDPSPDASVAFTVHREFSTKR